MYAAVGFWLVPKLLRAKAESFVADNYQRTLTIGDVRFNPFTLQLEVDGFSLPDADGEPLASFESLVVNTQISSLWRRGASFEEISLTHPYLRPVIRKNGELNFADLVKPFPEEPPPEGEEEEEPPRLFVAQLRIGGGHAHFEDRRLETPYVADLKPLAIEVRDFSTVGSSDNAYGLHAEAGSGASLDWGGSFTLSPLASEGRFKFENLDITKHWAYLRDSAGFEVTGGTLRFDGEYDFAAMDSGTQFVAKLRELGIAGLGIRRIGEEADTAKLDAVTVSGVDFDLGKNAASIEKVLVEGGSVTAWRDAAGQLNLANLTKPAGEGAAEAEVAVQTPAPAAETAPPADAEPGASPAFSFSAPDIELKGVVVEVEDRQPEPPIRLKLDPFNLRITGFSNAPD
ncbi:MAG TPA: DUF748 domain-containing protein, partial [Steroidobacteraceae bacterium]|nr:DUF748 domain-containing protein [Steroidobacteraceae bacterium]